MSTRNFFIYVCALNLEIRRGNGKHEKQVKGELKIQFYSQGLSAWGIDKPHWNHIEFNHNIKQNILIQFYSANRLVLLIKLHCNYCVKNCIIAKIFAEA